MDEEDYNNADFQTIVIDNNSVKVYDETDYWEPEYKLTKNFDDFVEAWKSENSDSVLDAHIEILVRSQMTRICDHLKFHDLLDFACEYITRDPSDYDDNIDFNNLPQYVSGTRIKDPTVEEWISVRYEDLRLLFVDLQMTYNMTIINFEDFCRFCYYHSSKSITF